MFPIYEIFIATFSTIVLFFALQRLSLMPPFHKRVFLMTSWLHQQYFVTS